MKGGDTRFFSVKNGLDWLLAERRRKGEEDSGLSLVAVHDGVRPFVSPEVVEACFDKAAVTGAVIPVVPMIDSRVRQMKKGAIRWTVPAIWLYKPRKSSIWNY